MHGDTLNISCRASMFVTTVESVRMPGNFKDVQFLDVCRLSWQMIIGKILIVVSFLHFRSFSHNLQQSATIKNEFKRNLFSFTTWLQQFCDPMSLSSADACEDGGCLQSVLTAGSVYGCHVAVFTGKGMDLGLEDSEFMLLVPMPWHRLGRSMRCILFVFI